VPKHEWTCRLNINYHRDHHPSTRNYQTLDKTKEKEFIRELIIKREFDEQERIRQGNENRDQIE